MAPQRLTVHQDMSAGDQSSADFSQKALTNSKILEALRQYESKDCYGMKWKRKLYDDIKIVNIIPAQTLKVMHM